MTTIIQDVIDALTGPQGRKADGVDTLLFGQSHMEVTSIGVTFAASQQVIEQASKQGINMIISHEGIFYNHHEPVKESLLIQDPVYEAKAASIMESGLAIYRCHDYWHQCRPDGIMEGLIKALGWQEYVTEDLPTATVAVIPTMTAYAVAEFIKKQLGIGYIRILGDLSLPCSRIGLIVGYRGGGKHAIPMFDEHNLDLMLYGEGPEWETPEYVRDAVYLGGRKALLVLGHMESEEPGMKLLAERLQQQFPLVPVRHLPNGPLFGIV